MKRIALLLFAAALSACGPQIGGLQKGETGRVVRVYNGDTLLLDSGLRVFLAEVDAPRGKQGYANQSRAELEALALNRTVELAYGGTRRWVRPPPAMANAGTPTTTAPASTATTTRVEPTGPSPARRPSHTCSSKQKAAAGSGCSTRSWAKAR